MDSDLLNNLFESVKKHWLPLSLAVGSLIFFGYGMITSLGTIRKPSEIQFDTSASPKPVVIPEQKIAIDIEGQIVKPGVYKLKKGSLVQDALVSSGGLTEGADRDWVAKNLNLALKLIDSQKIYIPKVGEGLSTSVLGAQTE